MPGSVQYKMLENRHVIIFPETPAICFEFAMNLSDKLVGCTAAN